MTLWSQQLVLVMLGGALGYRIPASGWKPATCWWT